MKKRFVFLISALFMLSITSNATCKKNLLADKIFHGLENSQEIFDLANEFPGIYPFGILKTTIENMKEEVSGVGSLCSGNTGLLTGFDLCSKLGAINWSFIIEKNPSTSIELIKNLKQFGDLFNSEEDANDQLTCSLKLNTVFEKI